MKRPSLSGPGRVGWGKPPNCTFDDRCVSFFFPAYLRGERDGDSGYCNGNIYRGYCIERDPDKLMSRGRGEGLHMGYGGWRWRLTSWCADKEMHVYRRRSWQAPGLGQMGHTSPPTEIHQLACILRTSSHISSIRVLFFPSFFPCGLHTASPSAIGWHCMYLWRYCVDGHVISHSHMYVSIFQENR